MIMTHPEKNIYDLTMNAVTKDTTIDEVIKSLPSDKQEMALVWFGFMHQRQALINKMDEADKKNYLADGVAVNKELEEQGIKIKAGVAEADKIMETEDIFNLLNMPSVSSPALMLVISRMDKIIKGNQQIPSKAKQQQTEDKWQPYRGKYDELLMEGMKSSLALYKIDNMIKLAIRDYPETTPFKKRPNRTTLHRQLVVQRK